MATITLSRRSSRSGVGREKGTGKVKEIIKDGIFNVNQFANWITGFKQDEVAHSSNYRVDIQRIRPTVARRYF